MPATLTTTQTALLLRAKTSPLSRVAVETGCITGSYTPRSYGQRGFKAAIALRDKGLFEHVTTDSGVDCGRLSSHHYSTHIFSLTQAGKDAI